MREELDALLSELKQLERGGVSSVLLEQNTLARLESVVKTEIENSSPEINASTPGAEAKTAATSTYQPAPPPKPKPKPKEVFDYHTLPEIKLPDGTKEEQWTWLKDRVVNCTICNNHLNPGKKLVFGTGDINADILFCGEAPGAEEEKAGEPFVGPAGQLLTKIIQAMGLSRDTVYIGNIMKWRPETDSPYGNRPPTVDEMAFCLPFLKAQIQLLQPKVIVALGATAVNGLLGHDPKRSITKTRGSWDEFENIPTIITFHPSYILRNGTNKVKRQIWEDMIAVMEKLEFSISEKQRNFFKS